MTLNQQNLNRIIIDSIVSELSLRYSDYEITIYSGCHIIINANSPLSYFITVLEDVVIQVPYPISKFTKLLISRDNIIDGLCDFIDRVENYKRGFGEI